MAQETSMKKRILLVEDDEDLCEAACIGLERHGYRVQAFQDPVAARQAFEAAPDSWDLLVTDQNMPQLNGVQLTRLVKRMRRDLPVILWTGMGSVSPETALAEGAALYLQKPVDNAVLVREVRRLMGD